MKTVRKGLFETNSSSVHSLTILTKKDFDKWQYNEGFLDWNENIVSFDEIIEEMKKSNPNIDYSTYTKEDWLDKISENGEWKSYEDYWNNNSFETGKRKFITPSGDEMVAVYFYGYDN